MATPMTHAARFAGLGLAITAIVPVVLLVGCGGHIGGSVDGGSSGMTGQTGGGGATGGAGHTGAGGHATGGTGAGGHATGGTGAGGSGTAGASGSLGGAGGAVTNAGCTNFTPDDSWNADISAAPVNANWTTRVPALFPANTMIHPDFGSDFGIPINIVPATQPKIPVTFDAYPEESDPGPYPFPASTVAIIEGGTPTNCSDDCHLIAVQMGTCQLYEGFACHYAGGWICGNGAHWDLTRKSQGQRPDGWTSADAAGLPIYPGLARYAEYAAGEITHAIRFTLPCTSAAHVAPATHQAVPGGCAGNANAPPMGLRIRLKASFDISGYSATAQVFLRAFKKYGLILADNGGSNSTLFFQSEVNANWDDDQINDLKRVPVNAFEAVNGP
jgi:hypothetical protein